MGYTKADHETIVRRDREARRVELSTSDAGQARRWARLGYLTGRVRLCLVAGSPGFGHVELHHRHHDFHHRYRRREW